MAASTAETFSEHNPTGRVATFLTRRKIDSYAGTFMVLVLTIFAAAMVLSSGLDIWDPTYLASGPIPTSSPAWC